MHYTLQSASEIRDTSLRKACALTNRDVNNMREAQNSSEDC